MKKSIVLFLSAVLICLFPITTHATVETDAGVAFSNSYTPTTSTEDTQLMPHEETSKGTIQISSDAKYPKTGSVGNSSFISFLGFLLLGILLLFVLKNRKKKKYD
ncbi:TPA: LPXTG cell wall anchor domain-containing protein [Enterococcus faecium]